jgi:hypothetical protein
VVQDQSASPAGSVLAEQPFSHENREFICFPVPCPSASRFHYVPAQAPTTRDKPSTSRDGRVPEISPVLPRPVTITIPRLELSQPAIPGHTISP